MILLTPTSRDQSQTLTQNYARLGLTSRLNTATGGVEKSRSASSKTSTTNRLAISNAISTSFKPTEARVIRDPVSGKILSIEEPKTKFNPLNDALNSDSEEEDEMEGLEGEGAEGDGGEERGGNIVKELERQAKEGGKKKRDREQSEGEKEWCERLVRRWGEDWGKMVRDRRLNPMQQTEGDLKRRIARWRAGGGVVAVAVEEDA